MCNFKLRSIEEYSNLLDKNGYNRREINKCDLCAHISFRKIENNKVESCCYKHKDIKKLKWYSICDDYEESKHIIEDASGIFYINDSQNLNHMKSKSLSKQIEPTEVNGMKDVEIFKIEDVDVSDVQKEWLSQKIGTLIKTLEEKSNRILEPNSNLTPKHYKEACLALNTTIIVSDEHRDDHIINVNKMRHDKSHIFRRFKTDGIFEEENE